MIWAIPRSYGLENKSNAADLRKAAVNDNLLRENDLVISCSRAGPLLAYHLERLGGAPDLQFASPLGPVENDRVMDWTDGGERMEDSTVAKNLSLSLITCPSAGGSSSCIRSRSARMTGTPLTELVRRRSAQWARRLRIPPRASCSRAPHRRATRIGVRGVVYEKTED